MKKIPAAGPTPADIMIVGEAPGSTEELVGQPFMGASGQELTKMLSEASINRTRCYITNVCKYRPPNNDISKFFLNKTEAKKQNAYEIMGRYPAPQIRDGLAELEAEIQTVRPRVIIALGDTALWALTGQSGITKWRGSFLTHGTIRVIPTYHPTGILRNWEWRSIAVHDLRRAASLLTHPVTEPKYSFTVRPSFTTVMQTLAHIAKQKRIAVDIETRARHIACLGIAWDKHSAICIPFMDVHRPRGYWSVEEEAAIIWELYKILRVSKIEIVGQNWMYDMQYIAKHWGFCPWPTFDTMLAQHVCFPGAMPKGLDFICSLYQDYYVYWKDEGKQWDPRYVDEEQLWVYNCKDCCGTLESSYILEKNIEKYNLVEPFKFQMKMVRNVMLTMLRGVRTDTEYRNKLAMSLLEEMIHRQQFLNEVLEMDFNPRSSPQMKSLFYKQFGVPPVLHKKTKRPTLNKNALGDLIKKADPLLHPIIRSIIEFRRLGTAYSVATVKLDTDQRFRTSYNLAGTETFRLASSEDAFGFGTNAQNISEGDE